MLKEHQGHEETNADPFQIDSMKIDGKYTPTAEELIPMLEKMKLQQLFQNATLGSSKNAISFETRDLAHLFALCLGAEGHRQGLFYFPLDDVFFAETLMKDYRVDSVVLSLTEQEQAGRSEVSINLYQGGKEYREKLNQLVSDVVSDVMPHLKID